MRLFNSQKIDSKKTGLRAIARGVAFALLCGLVAANGPLVAEALPPAPEGPPAVPFVEVLDREEPEEPDLTFPVRQIRVRGAKVLTAAEIADAIYPYLGMRRTLDDLEEARAALEKAYRDKGYQTVGVEIPEQNGTRGIIYMDAVENTVGRLRVRDSKYHLPSEIKRHAPSLAEGTVPNFNEVQEDILKLNAWPDRRVTPTLQPGVLPGTVDVDLLVEDSLPCHGSIEVNNRYSPGTTPTRLNGSLSYGNLWQRGHTLGLSTQLAPERIEDAEIYSGYYIARFARNPSLSLMLTATKQNSDVSTLGGAAVAGRGEIVGARAMVNLPGRGSYFHSFSFGGDYKRFGEDLTLDDETFSTPIDYWPFSLAYGGGWIEDRSFTEFNTVATWHFRGMGSGLEEFDAKRFDADGNFFHFRGDVSHTHELPGGFQAFGKMQGQATTNPLLNSEQIAGGGAATVRGYLESEALGDAGWFLTAELRTPSLLRDASAEDSAGREWRFHFFYDAGHLWLNRPLPEQTDYFRLVSLGLGTRFTLKENWEGSVEVAWPLDAQGSTEEGDPFVSFQMKAGF